MCNERPKTEREENLDEIIEHTDAARQHLRRAEKVARQSGDKDGAKELAEEAEAVEQTDQKFKGIRDKKTG
jgi:hypothetical protein